MPFGSNYIPQTKHVQRLVRMYVKIFGFPPSIGDRVRAYHAMKYLNPHANDVILDAGCGSGVYSLECSIKETKVISIDISCRNVHHALKAVKQVNLCNKVQFIVADICSLPFRDNSFDKILCVDVLEHIENNLKAFRSFSRVLKKAGNLILENNTKVLEVKNGPYLGADEDRKTIDA